MREIIMGYQGEMSLKGLNRNQFESAMMKILRYRLKTVGKFKVYCTQSTFYMEPEEEDVDMDLAFDRVRTVFGLAALSRAVVCEKDFDTICTKKKRTINVLYNPRVVTKNDSGDSVEKPIFQIGKTCDHLLTLVDNWVFAI